MISEIKIQIQRKNKTKQNKMDQNEIGHSPAARWVFLLICCPYFPFELFVFLFFDRYAHEGTTSRLMDVTISLVSSWRTSERLPRRRLEKRSTTTTRTSRKTSFVGGRQVLLIYTFYFFKIKRRRRLSFPTPRKSFAYRACYEKNCFLLLWCKVVGSRIRNHQQK